MLITFSCVLLYFSLLVWRPNLACIMYFCHWRIKVLIIPLELPWFLCNSHGVNFTYLLCTVCWRSEWDIAGFYRLSLFIKFNYIWLTKEVRILRGSKYFLMKLLLRCLTVQYFLVSWITDFNLVSVLLVNLSTVNSANWKIGDHN